jgi:hypothetical protein
LTFGFSLRVIKPESPRILVAILYISQFQKNKIWHLDQRVKILRLEREDIEEGIEPKKL